MTDTNTDDTTRETEREADNTGTLKIGDKEVSVNEVSFDTDTDTEQDDIPESAYAVEQVEFQGEIEITIRQGDPVPKRCPECHHGPMRLGATVDQLPTIECPECGYADRLNAPFSRTYGERDDG